MLRFECRSLSAEAVHAALRNGKTNSTKLIRPCFAMDPPRMAALRAQAASLASIADEVRFRCSLHSCVLFPAPASGIRGADEGQESGGSGPLMTAFGRIANGSRGDVG